MVNGGFRLAQQSDQPVTALRAPRPLPERVGLLALDIDDTLTGPDGKISPANLAAVRRAMDLGIPVTVVTGRRYRSSAERFADDIGLRGPIGCHYGRALVQHPAGAFVRSHPVPEAVCRRIVSFAAAHRVSPSLCVDETFFFDRSAQVQTVEGRMPPLIKVVDSLTSVLDDGGDRVMTISVSGPDAELVHALLAVETTSGQVTVHAQRVTGHTQSLIVVLAGSSDKGTALLDLCSLLGVDPREAVALGDSEADIPMLRAAACGIAMPWAEAQVRSAADRVAWGAPTDAAANEILALLDRRKT